MNHLELTRPFDPSLVKWRVGSTTKDKSRGMMLAYVDARDVMQRLDKAVGVGGWCDSYKGLANGTDICELSIFINGQWITKSDGAGFTKVEGEKGGISDAFKRAAVKWGIGRYLYYLGTTWAELQNGYPPKGFKGQLPEWALPENWEQHYPRMFGEQEI